MLHLGENRGEWARLVSLVCVVLLLVMGTAQAVHSHPDETKAPRHTCSICSTPNAKLNTAEVSLAPVIVASPLADIETSTPRIFRPATVHFVRPPPAA